MLAVGITPIGVSPTPPKIDALAKAYNIGFAKLSSFTALAKLLKQKANITSPLLLEVNEALILPQIEPPTPF